jgi:hypothetical protein
MKSTLIRTLTVAASLGVVVGCASTQDLQAVRDEVEQAKAEAAQAQATADQALAAAMAGQSCCDATNEKIDRMFKQSMLK